MGITGGASTPRRGLSGAWYLSILLVAPGLYFSAQALFDERSAFGLLPWSLAVLYTSAICAVVAWVKSVAHGIWPSWVRAWLMLGVLLWIYILVSESLQGQQTAGAAVLVPLTFFLVLLKRPTRAECWKAADVFAWTMVAASAAVLVLEVAHVIPAWYFHHGHVGENVLVFDVGGNYWLPFRDLLGLSGRWGGIDGYPNIAGQLGILLTVYGFARSGLRMYAFVTSGLLMLLLTDSRTSYLAGAVGLCLLAALPGWGASYWKVTPTRLLAVALGLAMAARVAVKIILDPGLTGRMAMWPEFFALARRFLTFGGGQQVIDSAIKTGELPPWAHQGHNLLLDTFVRFGVVGLGLALVFIGLAFVLTLKVFGREIATGFALLATLMTSCMGDLGFEWNYPSEALSVMLIAVFVSQLDAPKLLAGGDHAVNT